MYSLKSYSEQCYNIGSPLPSPARSPFKELPPNKASEFEFSPTPSTKTSPVKTSRKQVKRKLNSVSESKDKVSENSPKKARIMDENVKKEFMEFLAEQSRISAQKITDSLKATLDTRMDAFETKIEDISNDTKDEISNIGTKLNELKDNTEAKFSTIHDEFNSLKTTVTESASNNLEEIKETLVPIIKADITNEVKAEFKDEFNAVDAIWKASVADKVWEAEHNLLVFNLNVSKAPLVDAQEFLDKEMKVNEDTLKKVHLKRASRLGKGKNDKPPPLLMQFSHPSDRNLVLSHSKNLKGKPFRVEKDVPKLFKKAHAEFKEEAWKLREHFGYQTNISFNGHLMMLQIKNRNSEADKFHYIIHKEYFPPPCEALSLQKNSIPVPPGTLPTPPVNLAAKTKADCSVFMSGMKTAITSDLLQTKLNEILSAEHKTALVDAQLKKPDLAILYCDTWESCRDIANTYKEFNGDKVTFKMFTNVKPQS